MWSSIKELNKNGFISKFDFLNFQIIQELNFKLPWSWLSTKTSDTELLKMKTWSKVASDFTKLLKRLIKRWKLAKYRQWNEKHWNHQQVNIYDVHEGKCIKKRKSKRSKSLCWSREFSPTCKMIKTDAMHNHAYAMKVPTC